MKHAKLKHSREESMALKTVEQQEERNLHEIV